MVRVFKNKKSYSTENLASNRQLYSKSICFRPELDFLKYKKTLTNSVSNRFVFQSQFYKSYKLMRFYYCNLLRANFCKKTPVLLKPYLLKNFDNKAFFLAFNQYQSLKNFDNVLLWQGRQVNALFNLKLTTQKKRKKTMYTQHVYFLKPNKRLLFVWRWLTLFLYANVVKHIPRKFAYIPAFENFICAPKETHVITQFKYHVYKLHAVRNL